MRPILCERIGYYCSYCEFPVPHVPHAEHIVPKDRYPAWRDRWDNLLVACSWCNGHKGKTHPAPTALGDYLWPSVDNTARAFDYTNVVPVVSRTISPSMQTKAARTRGLVRLGSMDPDDMRARKRAAVYAMARGYLARLPGAPDRALAEDMLVDLARESGFFSVWMEVFAGELALRRRFIAAFEGTAQHCFNPTTTAPVPRSGGQV